MVIYYYETEIGLALYDDFLKLRVALNKFHIKKNPLRSDDGSKYNWILAHDAIEKANVL